MGELKPVLVVCRRAGAVIYQHEEKYVARADLARPDQKQLIDAAKTALTDFGLRPTTISRVIVCGGATPQSAIGAISTAETG